MIYVCLWSQIWSIGEAPAPELLATLLETTPRVAAGERGVVWAEGPVRLARAGGGAGPTGQAARAAELMARTLLDRLTTQGVEARAGIAAVPVVAETAARVATAKRPVVVVEPGRERGFLAPLPLDPLCPDERLLEHLAGVGIDTCGALAAVAQEAIEVRFGPDGVALWRMARADDGRRPFRPVPPERPHASLDFVDYVLTDPARLVFTANALLGNVCDALDRRGEHARRIALVLELSNGEVWRRALRAARPTASRETWLRLIRSVLDRITVPDAVAGVRLEVEATEPAAVRQGDLFDRGFETAAAVESAVARLLEAQGEVVVAPETCAHPLAERRTRWRPRTPEQVAETRPGAYGARHGPGRPGRGPTRSRSAGEVGSPDIAPGSVVSYGGGSTFGVGVARAGAMPGNAAPVPDGSVDTPAALTLQLLSEPRRVAVETVPRRDHEVPFRYRPDGRRGWLGLVTAAGPDRVSGGGWDAPFAREYFRCVSEEGALLWLFRDAREDTWYLHGWWD